jgi:hypothetical protein
MLSEPAPFLRDPLIQKPSETTHKIQDHIYYTPSHTPHKKHHASYFTSLTLISSPPPSQHEGGTRVLRRRRGRRGRGRRRRRRGRRGYHRATICASRGSPTVTWSVYQRLGALGWSHGLAGGEYYSAASSGSKSLFPLTWGVVWC